MKFTERNIYLLLISLVVLFSGLAVFGEIMEPDGALYAGIAKTMLLKNDWINLYVNGRDWLDKPHLIFWITAISFKIFGISAFAYKIPSFLLTLLGARYLYLFAKSIYSQRIALISVLIFLTALHLVISNFDVRAEGYLTAFIMAATYHYYKAHRGSYLHILPGSFFSACAVMVKGIFVVIPIFAGFIIYWLLTRDYKQLTRPKWWISILLILIFISPELYALYIQFDIHPEKLIFGQQGVSGIRFFFWDSQFGRFLNNGPIKGKGDVSFFLHTCLWAFLPWSLLFYTAIFSLFNKKHRAVNPPESIIIWSSASITFLIFSFSKFQLPHYIIILFPQFALITALYLCSLKERALQIFNRIQNGIFILVVILLSGIGLLSGFPYKYLLAGILFLILLFTLLLFRRRNVLTIVAGGSIQVLGIITFLYLFFYPPLLNYQAGMLAGEWLKQNHPDAKATIWMDANAFTFIFYAPGEVAYLDNYSAIEKEGGLKQMVFYTSETDLQGLKEKYTVDVLKKFDYYRITKLKGRFLNAETRATVLDHYYLVRLDQVQ